MLFLCFYAAAAWLAAADVVLSTDAKSFRMTNGNLAVEIDRSSARITAASLGGRDLLGGGSGYWSMSSSSEGARVGGFGVSSQQAVTIDPAGNHGERAEVACRLRGTGRDGAFPGTVEIRYALSRDATTLHAAAVLSHGPGDAALRVSEARFVLKLDPGIFNHLSIDKDRDRDMPSGREWELGDTLNLLEARRLTSGRFSGSVEHKYAYSAMLGETPAFGWSGNRQPFGVWMINPAVEYIAGGPTKMELTGHLDVGKGGRPTLLNMWHGSHYGGTALDLKRDEAWTKVIGPFAIHFNQGGNPGELWKKALAQAEIEQTAWPYDWFRHDAYPAMSGRGGVSGKLAVVSPHADDRPQGRFWVGLTPPDYELEDTRGPRQTIGWQRDGKRYQYWARARRDGSFEVRGVRPGNYVLRAFADGVWGEFARADIMVKTGATADLGSLAWTPERAGATLWQIGVADRSAAEYRNGDRYWEWGNYLRLKTDFPEGVDFTVGKSDWKKDWHICQALELSPDCEVLGNSEWTLRFPLKRMPEFGARLRIALCGARQGSHLSIALNGRELGAIGALPENGVMHRDSHRGVWSEHGFTVPAAMLKRGENVLHFRLRGKSWHQGVLYDSIRMESVDLPAAAAVFQQTP